MTEFERSLVNAINRFFEQNNVQGIAYRRKQHRFSSQFIDILVDSFNPNYYMAIENKSLKQQSASKLYFTQHFSDSKERHQVERISDFLHRSGRQGFLAVEVRRGKGRSREAFLIPWEPIEETYYSDEPGIPLETIRQYPRIDRSGTNYNIAEAIQA